MFNVDCYSKIIIFSLKWKKKSLEGDTQGRAKIY